LYKNDKKYVALEGDYEEKIEIIFATC
jgi:hypothetical protein